MEILLELQLREAHRHIQGHVGKGHKYPQFLSPMFLQRFPAIMDNQISVDWDTIMDIYDWVPLFPIMLIDTEVLDYWCTHPTVWEVVRNLQHSRWVLAIVHRTLAEGNKGKPVVVFGALLVYIPAHQAQTNLSDALSYLKRAKGDCIVLVSMPIKPTYSPQPRRSQYFTLLPINSNSGVDRGPLSSFAAATLHVASREGWGDNMAVQIKLPPCFGSSKRTKYELIVEAILSRGPLWQNVHFMERKNNGKVIIGRDSQPLCQELEVSLCPPSRRLEYTPTGTGNLPPLILVACRPRWDDFQDLGETVAEMSQCLIDEDGREKMARPRARHGLRWAKRKGGSFGNLHKCSSHHKFVSSDLGT